MGRATAGLGALVAVLVVGPSTAWAQDPGACRDVLAARTDSASAADTPTPCQDVAVLLYTLSSSVQAASQRILQTDALNPAEVFSQQAFQRRNPSAASMSGSFAQSEAIPSVMPTGVASGSLALVGSDAGDDALVALGLNPAILFLADEASEALARFSRFADLSVFLPVTSRTEPAGSGDAPDADADAVDYVGVRLRMNWLGLRSGDALWQAADSLLDGWARDSGENVGRLLSFLRRAPDLESCANALADNLSASRIAAACGGPVELVVDLDAAETLGAELSRIRRTLDSHYFGADVRADFGDPTLGAVDDASGTFLFAGIGYGRRFNTRADGSGRLGLRMRLGARHATLEHNDATAFAVEGGVGIELARTLGWQEINAAAALEFRYGDGDGGTDEQFQTDFAVLRTSLVIPITQSNNLSIAVGVPVAGEVAPYLSVNFNWGLLLSGASPLGG